MALRHGFHGRLGLDIGGTTTLAVLVSADGRVLQRARARTPAEAGAEKVLDTAADLVRRIGDRPTGSLGVGSAGVIEPGSGRVVSATAGISGWAGTDIPTGLRRRLGALDVYVVNDVHAFAWGELKLGAGRGTSSLLAVTVGTGIGGAVVVEQRIVQGAHYAAGHLGHMPVADARGYRCPCGGAGHVEAVASGPAMLAAYRHLGGSADDLTGVALSAEAGDATAKAVLAAGGTALGRTLAGLVSALDPEVVVVGGGVVGAGEPYLEPLRRALAAETLPALAEVPVRTAALGTDAVAIGAAIQGHTQQSATWAPPGAEVLS